MTDKGVKRHVPEVGLVNCVREDGGGELLGVDEQNSDRGGEDELGGCLAKESEEVGEDGEHEEEEEMSDDFLWGTGGFGLPPPGDLVLGREDAAGDKSEEEEQEVKKGKVEGSEKDPGLVVMGEEGLRGEDTGVPGVGVLD